MADRICEWITIVSPQDIHDSRSSNGQAWLDILRDLNGRKNHEGWEACHWGRVTEEEENLWILTSWKSQQAYETYKPTEHNQSLCAKLSSISTASVTTHILTFDHAWEYYRRFENAWPSVTVVKFPANISPERRDQIKSIRGLRPKHGRLGDQAMYGPAARGFLLPSDIPFPPNSTSPSPPDVPTYIFIDIWVSPLREADLRGPEQLVMIGPRRPFGEVKPLSTVFEEDLANAGALEVRTWHTRFNRLHGGRVFENSGEGVGRVFDWEGARRKREEYFEKVWKRNLDAEEGEEEDEGGG